MTVDMFPRQPRNHEREGLLDEMLVVIDVDRTLLKTDLYSDAIFSILARQGMKADVARLDDLVAHNTGNTFDLMMQVEQLGVSPSADELIDAANGQSFLYPGVDSLLGELEKSGIATMILTYGGLNGQRVKLEIIARELEKKGLSLPPSIITQEQRKAEWIDTSWERTEDGQFLVPEGIPVLSGRNFKRIIILDDKTSNLETPSDDIEGIKVDNSEEREGVPIGEAIDKIPLKLAH